MPHKFWLLYAWAVRTLMFFLPDIPVIMRLRGILYSIGMMRCGRNLQIAHSVIINGLDLCAFGNDIYIANGCNLILNGDLEIGDEVMFGPGVLVSTGNHQFDGNSYRFSRSFKTKVIIGTGSWVGGNSTLLGGAIIPPHSVVAAGSVVTKKSCENEEGIYGGVPASLIKAKKSCYQ